jgi:hypothetical protein
LLAAGLGSRRLTLYRPFPSAIAEGRRLALPPDGRRRPLQAPHTVPTERCWTPAGRHTERPGSLKELGKGPGATTHLRSPALNSVIEGSGILARGWHLRLWAPFLCLLTSSSFCPSSVFRESLGHRSPRGAPSTPPIRGSPAAPASWGYGRAPIPAAPYSGGGAIDLSPSPLQGQLLLLEDVQRCYPSRGHGAAAAPAFVGIPNSSSSATGTLVPDTRTLTRRGPSPDRLFADACRAKAPLRSWRSIIPIDSVVM